MPITITAFEHSPDGGKAGPTFPSPWRCRLARWRVQRDLMMVSVLLRLKASGILDEYPNLAAYVARGEARPAYKRAVDAQLAVNSGKPSTG